MVQNVVLRSSGSEPLVVAQDDSSDFVGFLKQYLGKKQYVTVHTVNGVMNNFDKLGHAGTIYRGSILDWLWNNQGRRVQAVLG